MLQVYIETQYRLGILLDMIKRPEQRTNFDIWLGQNNKDILLHMIQKPEPNITVEGAMWQNTVLLTHSRVRYSFRYDTKPVANFTVGVYWTNIDTW